jgi:hypothetical protein
MVMDRGYVDFARLYRIQLALAFFVIRSKDNLQYSRRYCVHTIARPECEAIRPFC